MVRTILALCMIATLAACGTSDDPGGSIDLSGQWDGTDGTDPPDTPPIDTPLPPDTPPDTPEPCADAICTADPYCCNNEWDNVCVEAALVDDACTCSI